MRRETHAFAIKFPANKWDYGNESFCAIFGEDDCAGAGLQVLGGNDLAPAQNYATMSALCSRARSTVDGELRDAEGSIILPEVYLKNWRRRLEAAYCPATFAARTGMAVVYSIEFDTDFEAGSKRQSSARGPVESFRELLQLAGSSATRDSASGRYTVHINSLGEHSTQAAVCIRALRRMSDGDPRTAVVHTLVRDSHVGVLVGSPLTVEASRSGTTSPLLASA